MKIKPEKLLTDLRDGAKLLSETSIKVEAPKVFIENLAQATKHLNNALEIWQYYDNQRSN